MKKYKRIDPNKQYKIAIPILCVVCIGLLLVPFLIHKFGGYSVEDTYTIDGLLGYLGATVSSIVALVLGFASYFQSERAREAEKKLTEKQRHEAIAPSLQVELSKKKDGLFALKIKNYSPFPAIDICLVPIKLGCSVLGNESREISFTINKTEEIQYLYLDGDYELDKNGMLKEITLDYSDMDNNDISQTFVLRGNEYMTEPLQYN